MNPPFVYVSLGVFGDQESHLVLCWSDTGRDIIGAFSDIGTAHAVVESIRRVIDILNIGATPMTFEEFKQVVYDTLYGQDDQKSVQYIEIVNAAAEMLNAHPVPSKNFVCTWRSDTGVFYAQRNDGAVFERVPCASDDGPNGVFCEHFGYWQRANNWDCPTDERVKL